MRLQLTVFLLLLPQSAYAAFTHDDRVCWRRDCVFRTDAGTLCFEPQHNGIEPDEECTNGFLKNLTHIHLTSTMDRSILYYDDKARVLGAAMWDIPPTMEGSVFVCMTGQHVDDPERYRTVCREAHGNDDMATTAVHTTECVSDKKPRYINDGCFSLKESVRSDDEHKEWYEQPVIAGLFWVFGAIVTIGSMYLLVGKAAQAAELWLPQRLVACTAVFKRLTRSWRRVVPPLPTQQPASISQQIHTSRLVFLTISLAACAQCKCRYSAAQHPETFALYASAASPYQF